MRFEVNFHVFLRFLSTKVGHKVYLQVDRYGWWSGVVVSALASINEVNQRRARLVLRPVTVS